MDKPKYLGLSKIDLKFCMIPLNLDALGKMGGLKADILNDFNETFPNDIY